MTDKKQLHVYVIHVEYFKYRKTTCERLRELLQAHPNFDVTFNYISEYDPQNISQDEIRKFVNYDQLKEENLKPYNGLIKNIHINQLSNALKHYRALEHISQTKTDVFSIIIEDDVVFNDNVADVLENALNNVPENYDMLFLGLPSAKDVEGKNFQKISDVFKVLPCCDSYLVSKSAAQTLVKEFTPVKFTNNVQLSYLLTKLDMTAHLSVPNVFIDGSKLGLYFSSLEVNNRLIFNQDYVTLSKLVLEKDTFTTEECATIDKYFMDVKLKTNPEFYYLKALFEVKKQNYEFAKAIFDYTYELYESNGAVLNNQSSFLRDYMKVYKYLQI